MQTIIFLGPTLATDEAKQILPEAMYLPPVRCSDVLRALRLRPKIIGIIDGFFEHIAAVWHKEILMAMDAGVIVYGASSMGALRAAELSNFGMRGIGKIYQDFSNGVINDDDEVAILHAPRSKNYLAMSDAMVNIRATVAKALNENVLDKKTAEIILQTAKALPYQQRNYAKLGNDKLVAWLKNENNNVDQKKLDAIELLELLSRDGCRDVLHTPTNRSVFLRALHNDVMCRPFQVKHDALPQQEKVALAARLFGDDYRFTRRLSYLWSAVFAVAKSRQNNFSAKKNIFANELPQKIDQWMQDNDCDGYEYQNFLERLQLVDGYIATQKDFTPKNFLLALMRTSDDYQTYNEQAFSTLDLVARQNAIIENFAKLNPLRHKILYLSAICWCAIEYEVERFNLVPEMENAENFSNQFRSQKKLFTPEAMQQWLQQNDLDFDGYTDLMLIMSRMRFMVLQTNLDAINVFQDNVHNIWWLLDMLRLSELYVLAKRTLSDNNFKQETCLKLKEKKQILNNSSAYLFDFVEGSEEFVAEFSSFE